MYRIYDIDEHGEVYAVTGLIANYNDAKLALTLMHKEHPDAYIRATEE